MNDPLFTRLRETAWRRKLTASEQSELDAWLAAHPEAQAEWDLEIALTHSLSQLPPVPVPSNFVSRVVQAVEQRPAAPAIGARWHWRSLLPRAGIAAVALMVGAFSYHHHQVSRRAQDARAVAMATSLAEASDPQVLQDFFVILKMSRSPRPDEGILLLGLK